jgi:hypothetical protein
MTDKPEKKMPVVKKSKEENKKIKENKNIEIITEKLHVPEETNDTTNDTTNDEINIKSSKITIGIIIVDKSGSLKQLTVKDYYDEELYKKCGFKKPDGFTKHTSWSIKLDGRKYSVSAYGKTEGKANMENKYDFPPPIDNTLFFGSCALVCSLKQDDGKTTLITLSLDQWTKMYEKLFGGFEDLAATCQADEEEEDELDQISASKKTKHGYLKDGFVVDSDGENDETTSTISDSETLTEEDDTDDTSEDALILEDIGSELSEESYEDEDEDEDNAKTD